MSPQVVCSDHISRFSGLCWKSFHHCRVPRGSSFDQIVAGLPCMSKDQDWFLFESKIFWLRPYSGGTSLTNNHDVAGILLGGIDHRCARGCRSGPMPCLRIPVRYGLVCLRVSRPRRRYRRNEGLSPASQILLVAFISLSYYRVFSLFSPATLLPVLSIQWMDNTGEVQMVF